MVSVGYCETQPLQLTIKSDKEVCEVGDESQVNIVLKNMKVENHINKKQKICNTKNIFNDKDNIVNDFPICWSYP